MLNNFLDSAIDEVSGKSQGVTQSSMESSNPFLDSAITEVAGKATPVPIAEPTKVNVDAYNIESLFGKIAPKVPEIPKQPDIPMRRTLRKIEESTPFNATRSYMRMTTVVKDGIATTTYPGKSNVPEGYEEILEPVQSISRSNDKPNFIERSLNALTGLFGADNVGKLSEGAKAQALVMHMAKEANVPLNQYRQSPEFIEQAASSFISMSTLGLAPAIKKGLTGEVDYPATNTFGYVGGALGSLAGLYGAPMYIAGKLVKPVLNFLPQAFQNEAVAARMLKGALRDSVMLGPALGLSATGEALEQVTFSQAADKIWEGTKSGAMIGTIFGVSRGLFPKEGIDTGARIFTGLVGLNAYRAAEVGGNPFTNRPIGDVLFDVALDAFFLYKGLPKNMRFEVAQDLADLNTKIDKAKNPPPAPVGEGEIPPEILQQAQAKVAEVEKVQIELEAKRIEEKAKAAIEAKAELEVKGEEIKEIKEGKEPEIVESLNELDKAEELDPDLRAILEEGDNISEPVKSGVEILEPKAAAVEPVTSGIDILEPKKPKVIRRKGGKKEPVKVVEQPQPITEVDLQTGTPLPEKLSPSNHPFRDKDKAHTDTMSWLYIDKIKSKDVDPEVFTRYMINEVNRWLNGDEPATPIEKLRNGLSNAATNAENARHSFDRTADFEAWKDNVQEAARWAREAERPKEVKFTIGVDPTEIKKVVVAIKDNILKLFPRDPKIEKTGYIFSDGEAISLAAKDSSFAVTHEDGILSFDSLTDKKIRGVLDAKNKDLVNEYLNHSGTVRYIRESGNILSVQVGQRLSLKQLRVIKDNTEPKDTIYLDMPEESRTIKARQLESVINEYFDAQDRLIDKRTGGEAKLTMGIDPTQIPEATRKIIAGAKALANYTAKARGMKEWKLDEATNKIREEFIRSGVDRSGNIRRELLDQLGDEGYRIIQKMYLSKGASSLAAQQLKQMRNEVYSGLTRDDKRILDNLILADRMLDIGKYKTAAQFKFPEGLTPTEAASYNELFQYTEKITPEKADLLRQKAGAYFEWMKKPLKDMLDAELIDQTEYDALSSHNYRRLKLVDVFDKRYQTKIGKTKKTVYDSGVEALSHGRSTDVFEPSSEVMALEVFNRAYGRILNNGANRTLLDLARTQKDNPFVAVKDSPTDHIPSGWDRIFVYEKGERKAIYISPEMAKEWITNSPEMSYKLSQFIRYASGSPVLRTFATGIDWGFALANLPRDVMHTWYAARVFEGGEWKSLYNSTMPVYFSQMGGDLGGVFNDAILRKGKYEDYIKEGGGMEFLVHQGRLMQRGRHIEGNIDKMQNFLGYLGETSEIVTRLAIRDRVIKRRAAEQGISYEEAAKDKKITQEATFAARDYMDFGQGGGVSKALDNGLPYLNASIQGTRGIFRAFKDNKAESTYKLAQFAALVTGLYIANQSLNPKTMESLKGSIDVQGNLTIPLGDGFGFLDEKGQQHYPYFKIPLDPGQKFFKMFFEASYDKATGQTVDVKGLTNSMSQISPVAISSLPPTVSGTLGYLYNKDFWSNEDIWKKTDKALPYPKSKEEYIPGKTPQSLIDVGSVTGLSPERLKYALSELVTSGSMWSWLVGQGYDAAFHDLPKNKKEFHLAETLSKTPIFKRFIGITNPYTQFATPIEEARDESMVKRWIENRGLDQRVESFLYEGGKRSEVIDYIKNTAKDQDTQDRLKDRFIFQEKIKDLPNRSFWLALKGTPDTESRAKLYVQRYDAASEVDREQLMREVGIVQNAGGVISDEFKQQVMRVRDAKARGVAK